MTHLIDPFRDVTLSAFRKVIGQNWPRASLIHLFTLLDMKCLSIMLLVLLELDNLDILVLQLQLFRQCVCTHICALAGTEQRLRIYFTQQFSPRLRWGVVHLLDSFSSPVPTQSCHKVIQAPQNSGRAGGEAPKGPRWGGKEDRAATSAGRQSWGEENPWHYCGFLASLLFVAPGSPIPLLGSKVEIFLHMCVQQLFIQFCVYDVAGGFGCCWLHKGKSPECVVKTWQVKSGFFPKSARFCGQERTPRSVRWRW